MEIGEVEDFEALTGGSFGWGERVGFGFCEPGCEVEGRGWGEGAEAYEVLAEHLHQVWVCSNLTMTR